MTAGKRSTEKRSKESGVSILIIAVSMIFVLGMAGLGIDLASLYVGRSEAQRAADAAALAGAGAFVFGGCATGTTGSGLTQTCMTMATQRAEAVGNANLIQGVSPDIQDSDISFPNQTSSDPQIQVVAGRGIYDGADHGNAMPTFFMKIFGINTASVSAKATAEAFNPSGTPQSIGSTCVKPWMFPNCDQFNTTVGAPNNDCDQSGGTVGPFVIPSGNGGFTVARPADYPNGAIGEPYVIKPGSVSGAAAPGQFYAAYLPTAGSIPSECPSCATVVNQGGSGSGALYRSNIECCNTNELYCGETLTLNTTLQTTPGNMVGPTYQGVNCLIHQDSIYGTSSCGQDYVQGLSDNCNDPQSQNAADLPLLPANPPLIMPGANNPYNPSGDQPISNSDSVIVAPIYNGVITSGQNTVQIAGFAQIFIRDAAKNQQGTIYSYILGISGCGTGGTTNPGGNGGSGGPVTSTYGTSVPVRLIN